MCIETHHSPELAVSNFFIVRFVLYMKLVVHDVGITTKSRVSDQFLFSSASVHPFITSRV